METIPIVMRAIKEQMRRRKPADLSHSQFRVLIYLARHGGISLSHLARRGGVTPPTMSKMVNGLVKRGLVSREHAEDDRRRVILALTDLGKETLAVARRAARKRLASLLATLPEEEIETVSKAMDCLGKAFQGVHDDAGCGTGGRSASI